jgi:hypothetical protein
VPDINAALRKLDHPVDDPEGIEDASAAPKASKAKKEKASKANIEATSDEEEDGDED